MLRLLVVIAALVCAGCGSSDHLPPAGASGGGEFRFWNAGQGRPVVVRAGQVRQHGTRFDDLVLSDVDIRMPMGEGAGPGAESDVLCIQATSAIAREEDGARVIVLDGGHDAASGQPVRVIGILKGVPFAGRATSARIILADQRMDLTEVEMVHQGDVTSAPHGIIPKVGTMRFRPFALNRVAVPPIAVMAALAALPQSLVLAEPE